MGTNQIIEDLNNNLQELSVVENEISMIQLALYRKSLEDLGKSKLNEIKQYFEQQAEFYGQKFDDYQDEVNEVIENYNKQLKELIKSYDYLYVNFFKMMQEAINNQKIAVANVVTLKERLNKKEKVTSEEEKRLKNTIIACIQKKLNYSVIIDECKARINWCIENARKDVNEIFSNNIYQIQEYKKENIILKIRRKIFNWKSGKSKYDSVIKNYKIENLQNIKEKKDLKIWSSITILIGVIKQMDIVKKQIIEKYNAMLV